MRCTRWPIHLTDQHSRVWKLKFICLERTGRGKNFLYFVFYCCYMFRMHCQNRCSLLCFRELVRDLLGSPRDHLESIEIASRYLEPWAAASRYLELPRDLPNVWVVENNKWSIDLPKPSCIHRYFEIQNFEFILKTIELIDRKRCRKIRSVTPPISAISGRQRNYHTVSENAFFQTRSIWKYRETRTSWSPDCIRNQTPQQSDRKPDSAYWAPILSPGGKIGEWAKVGCLTKERPSEIFTSTWLLHGEHFCRNQLKNRLNFRNQIQNNIEFPKPDQKHHWISETRSKT